MLPVERENLIRVSLDQKIPMNVPQAAQKSVPFGATFMVPKRGGDDFVFYVFDTKVATVKELRQQFGLPEQPGTKAAGGPPH